MKNLFALLVGINNYMEIRNLSGCENDVERISGFLSKFAEKNFAYHETKLVSKAATKHNIVDAFHNHIIEANTKSGDILLFYFSGHGAEETANPVFWDSDTNQRMQVLACHDSNPSTGSNFLADKELRYLIQRAAKPSVDIVTIFDCCHSGDNTRSLPPNEVRERLAGQTPARTWSEFIFAHEIFPETIQKETLAKAIPQGRHIQISACDSHESAYEKENEGGFFTKALLDVLEQTRGDISYLDLKNQTRNAIRQMNLHTASKPQTPKIYAFNGMERKVVNAEEDMLFRTFLGGIVKDKPLPAEVYFNRQKQRWEVDKGAIYGVRETWNGIPQQVVVPVDKDMFEYATITKAYPGFSVLEFDPYADIHPKVRYSGVQIPSLMSRALRISVNGEQEGVDYFLKESPEGGMAGKSLSLVSDTQHPEYRILAHNNQYLITLPNNPRPLTRAIGGYSPMSVSEVHELLAKLVKWNFLKHLKNPEVTGLESAFDVVVSQYGHEIKAEGNDFIMQLPDRNDKGLPAGRMSLTLHNRTKQPLFYGAVYLSTLFGINENVVEGGVVYLDPEKPLHLRKDKGFSIEPFIRDFNWEEETYHILIIAAASEFSLELFRQSEAQAPTRSRSLDIAINKDISLRSGGTNFSPEFWQTKLLTFHLPNPYFVA